MIEILFAASLFQCGVGAPQAEFALVYQGEQIFVNDRIYTEETLEEFLSNVAIQRISNADCSIPTPFYNTLGYGAPIPNLPGFDSQTSLATWHNSLEDQYESLVLVELGTSDISSPAFDLQDIILLVDTNPDFEPYAD